MYWDLANMNRLLHFAVMKDDGNAGGAGSRSGKRGTLLGGEMSRAMETERRHWEVQATQASPLLDVEYHLDAIQLWRWVPAAQDDIIAAVVTHYRQLSEAARGRFRTRLTMHDFYTILTFARRSGLAAVRYLDPAKAETAMNALAMIELARIDFRDLFVAAEIATYAAQRIGRDVEEIAACAAQLAESPVAAVLEKIAAGPFTPGEQLGFGGYREMVTPAGAAFLRDNGAHFAAEADLVALGFDVAKTFEDDRYRVRDVTIGCELPEVYVGTKDNPATEQARGRLAGCLMISADPRIDPPPNMSDQILLAFLLEAATDADAVAIATAAQTDIEPSDAKLSIASRRLCAVLVARSTMLGIPSPENVHSLERFRAKIELTLTNCLSAQL
jgi:hypothetical protein